MLASMTGSGDEEEDEEEDEVARPVAPPTSLTFDPCGSSILQYDNVGLTVIVTIISIMKKRIKSKHDRKPTK